MSFYVDSHQLGTYSFLMHACLSRCLIGQGRLLRSEASEAPCGSLAAASFSSTCVAWPRAQMTGTGPHGALWLIVVRDTVMTKSRLPKCTCAPRIQLTLWLAIRGLVWNAQRPLPGAPTVGVSNKHWLVNL